MKRWFSEYAQTILQNLKTLHVTQNKPVSFDLLRKLYLKSNCTLEKIGTNTVYFKCKNIALLAASLLKITLYDFKYERLL